VGDACCWGITVVIFLSLPSGLRRFWRYTNHSEHIRQQRYFFCQEPTVALTKLFLVTLWRTGSSKFLASKPSVSPTWLNRSLRIVCPICGGD